jgi:uncharacterized membrane protein YedE/YeeE
MKNKVQIGILTFFFGLAMIFGALYLDEIRGIKTESFGLYQIIGAFLGYTILGLGLVLILQDVDTHKSVRKIFYIGGGIIGIVSALADYLGVAGPSGVDRYQIVGMIFGAVLVGIGVILPQSLF